MKKDKIDKKTVSQFKNAEELDDYFSKMYKEALQSMLEGELDNHLGHLKHERTDAKKSNYRNGSGKKKIKSKYGELEIDTPRDRNSSFKPQIIEKRKSVLGKIEDIVIGLYSRGMSVRDIEDQIEELYGITISDTEVSRITNKLLDQIKQWQNRPLEESYPIIWLDAIHIKIKDNYTIKNKAIYIIVGLNFEGYKEPLSIWIDKTESATFWLQVLDDLKSRGVKDVIFAVSDNLTGLTESIKAAFPNTITQICIVHQIRNSLRRIPSKDKAVFTELLKDVYKAPNEEQAAKSLQVLDENFGQKYPWVIRSWKNNWDNLIPYLNVPSDIRKLIYTTNIIENLNRVIRKYTKNRTMFPNDNSALKAVFLAVDKMQMSWKKGRINHWQLVIAQLELIFEDRIKN